MNLINVLNLSLNKSNERINIFQPVDLKIGNLQYEARWALCYLILLSRNQRIELCVVLNKPLYYLFG